MKRSAIPVLALALLGSVAGPTMAAPSPAGLQGQLPSGYEVLAKAELVAGAPGRRFVLVALGRRGEGKPLRDGQDAPSRPLMIFEVKDGRYQLAGRNDQVVLRADEGGQCDPFLDGDGVIAVKGPYFTVQNGVACGEHWTDYITFRFDTATGGFVFDNERSESWRMNPSEAPDADALVRDGKQKVRKDRPGQKTAFSAWKRSP